MEAENGDRPVTMICKACRHTVGHRCPLGQQNLTEPDDPLLRGDYMVCKNEATPIHFSVANRKSKMLRRVAGAT